MSWKIPLFKIYWDDEDVASVVEAITSGMNWASGPSVEIFEDFMKEYLGVKYCISFNSGTSALHTVLMAHGLKEGQEVIVPSFTFIATANAPLFIGAKPVFADIERETLGLDPESIKEKITEKTAAIMPIHFGGCPCKVRELKEIAEDYNLLLIEDAAEALGASINGVKIGNFGDSAVFSFCQNKIVTTGEGGAVTTESKDVYEKMKLIRSHGRLETANYFSTIEPMDYMTLGYNFRMSNITAALGISQLKKADKIIRMRRSNAEYLTSRLKAIDEITTLDPPRGYYDVYQMYTVMADRRDELMKHLAGIGIMTKVYFPPVHLTHFYRRVMGYNDVLPVTEEIATRALTLPFYPSISHEEMDTVVDGIAEFYSSR